MSESTPKASSGAISSLKAFAVKAYKAVALWSWDISVETCAICQSHIMSKCIDCQVHASQPTADSCTVAWGACGHAYHFHCISRWLSTRPVCPLDDKEWVFTKYGK